MPSPSSSDEAVRAARRLATAAAGTAALGAAALAYALLEAQWFALRWTTVPALTAGARPLRILHVSDLHLVPGEDRKREFVQGALRSGPDLVVATGDLLGHPDAVDEAVALLAPLAAERPAVYCLGSNDFWGPALKSPARYFAPWRKHIVGKRLDTGRLVDGLRDTGWISAENRHIVVDTVAGCVEVFGLGDAHVDHDRPGEWDRAAPVPEAGPVLRLGVAHAPYLRVLDRFAAEGVDLALAGHTHGGQVRVPGYGALVDNCDLPLRQARGLSAHTPSMWLHVSAGLGQNRFTPIRFACRPEATVVDVVARTAEDGAGAPMAERAGAG